MVSAVFHSPRDVEPVPLPAAAAPRPVPAANDEKRPEVHPAGPATAATAAATATAADGRERFELRERLRALAARVLPPLAGLALLVGIWALL